MDPTLAHRLVGIVEADTPVETQYRKRDIQSNTQTRIETDILIEVVEMEYRTLGILAILLPDHKYVTRVEEQRAVEHTPNRETEFEIGLDLHITHLTRIDALILGDRHTTRTECSCRPTTHRVATARIEQTVDRDFGRVAIRQTRTCIESIGQRRLCPQHLLAAEREVGTEILRVANTEDIVVVAIGFGLRQQVRQRTHKVTRRLPIKAEVGSVAVDVSYLIIKYVRARDTRNQLLRVAIAQVGILQAVEEFGIDISHLNQRQVDRTQSVVRVATISPGVAPRCTRQHSLIVGTILRIDRQLDLRARIRDRCRAADIEGHDKSRERQRGRTSDLECTFALRLGALHKLITERERHIEQLHSAEDVVVLVTDRTAQTVETRRRRPFQLDLIALRQGGCAEDIAVQVALLGR